MSRNELVTYAKLPAELREQRDFILLDGSSSMANLWRPMCRAIDWYMRGLRDNATESLTTLSVFSSDDIGVDVRDEWASTWTPLAEAPIRLPGGGTPLYDAINRMCRRLRDEDPLRCSILVVTDGEANGMQATSEIQARQLLKWCEAKGWQVTFLGCDWDNSRLAALMGLQPQQAIGVGREHLNSAAAELAKKRSRHATSGAPMHWSEDERSQFGGYLGRG